MNLGLAGLMDVTAFAMARLFLAEAELAEYRRLRLVPMPRSQFAHSA